jgi:hypothetical protein
MSQKLDSFSKILIATAQINYMAASIDSVNEQIKFSGLASEVVHNEGVNERDDILRETVTDLAAIMEKLGNLINNHDCLCAIDERVAKVPFEIIVHGKDDTEKDYEDEEE